MSGHSGNLAVFYRPMTDEGERQTEWIDYRPTGQLTSDGALEFNVPGNSTKYIDLKNTRLKIKCKILQANGSNLPSSVAGEGKLVPEAAKVGPVNLFLQSLWRQVDVSLQQKVISPEVATRYAYKAYLDTILGYGTDAKRSQLSSQLYYKDEGDPSSADPISGTNTGLILRSNFTEESKTVDLEGPIYNDMCQQNRYILNGVQIGFKFWPSANEFKLMSSNPSADYKVEIVDAVLKICMKEVAPEIILAHAATLRNGPALYFYDRTDVKAYGIAKGQFGTTIEDIYQGEVPSRLVVGLVASKGATGDYSSNPFEFKDFNTNFAGFYLEGKSMPMEPLTPNYKNSNYTSAYLTLFGNQYMENSGNYIAREEYPNGYCLYVFDVCQNQCEKHGNSIKRGHTRFEIKFSEALSEPVTLIMYANFPGLIEIDESRNVKVN